jgi:hypothetical protein
MSIHSIRRFDPFNLQHGPAIGFHTEIQEIIFYAESRFRSIAESLTTAGDFWTQKLLRAELVRTVTILLDIITDRMGSFMCYLLWGLAVQLVKP